MDQLLFVLCGTPPQARQCGYRQDKVCHELPKLVDPQGFPKDVGYLKVRVDVLQVDISGMVALSDEVIMHFDMLCVCVEHRGVFLSQMNTGHVVVVEENQILDGNTQILHYSFEPNRFTSIFSFYA